MALGSARALACIQPAPSLVGLACSGSMNGGENLSGGMWLARRQPPHATARALPAQLHGAGAGLAVLEAG